MLRVTVVASVAVLFIVFFVQRAPLDAAQQDRTFDHSAYDRILRATVADGLVDYDKLKAQHADALRSYLKRVATTDIDALPRAEQLALYVNLYNAAMLDAVINRLEPGFTVAANDFALFKQPLVALGEQRVSLDHIEHDILRKVFRDERIHGAINCASLSCPKLRNRAYTGDKLHQQLTDAMQRYLADPRRNRIEQDGKVLKLAKIFEWFAEDFGGKDNLPAYLSKFSEERIAPDAAVTFLEYDWSLNAQSGTTGG